MNAKTKRGFTALRVAAQDGHQQVVELLLAKGADVNAKLPGGFTPLRFATLNGHQEVAELLRKHGGT